MLRFSEASVQLNRKKQTDCLVEIRLLKEINSIEYLCASVFLLSNLCFDGLYSDLDLRFFGCLF